jgi:hypothetical protein
MLGRPPPRRRSVEQISVDGRNLGKQHLACRRSLLSVVASFSSWSSVKFSLLHVLTVQENSGAGDLANRTVTAALAGPSDSHRDVAGKDLRGVLEHGNQWQVCYSRGARSQIGDTRGTRSGTRGEPGWRRAGAQASRGARRSHARPVPMIPDYVNEMVGGRRKLCDIGGSHSR